MNNPLQIGIIGCGSISKLRHAPEYAKNSNTILSAIYDLHTNRAEELTEKFGGRMTHSYQEILSDPNIDAVSVCTANNSHAQICIAALQAGKHVLCEKPMALTTDDAKKMICAAEQSQKFLIPAHNQRLFKSHQKAKEILDSGSLGKVISFSTTFSHSGPETWSADKGANTWFMSRSGAGYGVLGDLGIHKIDLLHFLLKDQITDVFASLETCYKRNHLGKMINVEDEAVIICHTAKGIPGTIRASWNNYGSEENHTVLCCERGTLKINCYPGLDIVIERKGCVPEEYQLGGNASNEKQLHSGVIDAFVDTLLHSKPPFTTAIDGYNSIAVLEACVISSRKKTIMQVKPYI